MMTRSFRFWLAVGAGVLSVVSILVAVLNGPVSGAPGWAHRYCLGTPWLLWASLIGDVQIFAAYMVLPTMLVVAAARGWAASAPMFYLFAAFIFACGITHAFGAYVMFVPAYRLEAFNKLVTGCISWATVAAGFYEYRRARPALRLIAAKIREAAAELKLWGDGELSIRLDGLSDILQRLGQVTPPVGGDGGA